MITGHYTDLDKAVSELSRLDNWIQTQALNKGRATAREIREDQSVAENTQKMLQEMMKAIQGVQTKVQQEMSSVRKEIGSMHHEMASVKQQVHDQQRNQSKEKPDLAQSNLTGGRGRGHGGYFNRGRGGPGRGYDRNASVEQDPIPPGRGTIYSETQSHNNSVQLNMEELSAGPRAQLKSNSQA